jgi:hypothetical protein
LEFSPPPVAARMTPVPRSSKGEKDPRVSELSNRARRSHLAAQSLPNRRSRAPPRFASHNGTRCSAPTRGCQPSPPGDTRPVTRREREISDAGTIQEDYYIDRDDMPPTLCTLTNGKSVKDSPIACSRPWARSGIFCHRKTRPSCFPSRSLLPRTPLRWISF